MVSIPNHNPAAVDSSVGPLEESDTYMLTIRVSTISLMGWENKNLSKESLKNLYLDSTWTNLT